MTDVLPAVMNDLVQHAPENQKEKITKLLDIWQRGQTFPLDMLANFKQQVNGSQLSKCFHSYLVLLPDGSVHRCSNRAKESAKG